MKLILSARIAAILIPRPGLREAIRE